MVRYFIPKKFSLIHILLIIILPFASVAQTDLQEGSNSMSPILLSAFTSQPIAIDGVKESAWDKTTEYRIDIPMTADLSSFARNYCKTYGVVRSLWDGAQLYLFIDVYDSDISGTAEKAIDQDGVEIYVDLWNDKFPKYEEDDMLIRISSRGAISGIGSYNQRLKGHAVAPMKNDENNLIGYSVELALAAGGVPIRNGSKLGLEFCLLDAASASHKLTYRVFWSDEINNGLNDNTRWGTWMLTGYEASQKMKLDTFMLQQNIKKAEAIQRGIWESETALNHALTAAKKNLSTTSQLKIDEANAQLENAIQSLRRKGKYNDPYLLPEVGHLPDPFTFLDGSRVKSISDWNNRREEIKNLAQYYEYGYMPAAPERVTATVDTGAVVITVQDKGKQASFSGVLTIPTTEQCGKRGPYPVIVSIDFRPHAPNPLYLNAGYAVLSIIYSTVASDSYTHEGAYYTLYPYDVITGHDAGTLLAWAWGASRGLDALHYLSKNASYVNLFDLSKVAVTGFSRCGKAALAAGLFDKRFGVVIPGASGCGGAAVYRYDSFGNVPYRTAPFGNIYNWGTSPGCEVLVDKIRHQGHNANEMLARFLNPGRPYQTNYPGYGQRLPYDHHEIIAAIAPRAVLITTANDDYANNAEGDCIGLAGAQPVFHFLHAKENLALNLRTTGERGPRAWAGGHWLSDDQIKNIVAFVNYVFYDTPLPEELKTAFYSNPYESTFNKYYGGLKEMMPWLDDVPE